MILLVSQVSIYVSHQAELLFSFLSDFVQISGKKVILPVELFIAFDFLQFGRVQTGVHVIQKRNSQRHRQVENGEENRAVKRVYQGELGHHDQREVENRIIEHDGRPRH